MAARWTHAEYADYCKRRLSTSNSKKAVTATKNAPDECTVAKMPGRAEKCRLTRNSGVSDAPAKPLFIRQVQMPQLLDDGTLQLPHTVVLPMPPRCLWGNRGSASRWGIATARKAYKSECGWVLMEAGIDKAGPVDRPLSVSFRWVFTRKARRDIDNLIAGIKCALDSLTGIVWVDDSQVSIGAATQVVLSQPMEWLEMTIREIDQL